METDLIEMLRNVGYGGSLMESEKLVEALELGAKSTEFTGLVSWICEQLAKLNEIDETVHPTSSSDDSSSFLLELSFFLKELGCINPRLMTANVNQRLANKAERMTLLEYLLTELMASQMLEFKYPQAKSSMVVTLAESDTAKCLREMLLALKFQKPPDNISPEVLFTKVQNKLDEVISAIPADLLGRAMFFGELSSDQWSKLNNLQEELHKEYTIRREMLLKRLDVTVQSFLWSERTKALEDELNRKYNERREKMVCEPNVAIADLLAARDDLAIIEKTSNAVVRKNTRSKVNSVMIGTVPDRGGRPYEQEPPPPEMPPWQKDRVAGPPSRGGYGGGGRGGSGGRGSGGSRGGGANGGYRDSKSAMSNFGQNVEAPSGYANKGGGEYHGGGYQDNAVGLGYQGGPYQPNRGGGGYQGGGGGYYDNRGHQGGEYRDSRGSGGYQDSGYQGNMSGGNYQRDHRRCAGYQDNGHQGGGRGYQRGGGGGRGGRVQGGWNQAGGNYQRGAYNRGGHNQYR